MDRYIKNLLNSKSEKNSGTINISSGGIVTNMSLKTGAELIVSSGGIARNITNISGGTISIMPSATVYNSSGYNVSSANVNGGYLQVFSGTSVYDSIINSNGMIFVSNNATANNITISSGHVQLYSNATISSATVQSGFLNLLADNSFAEKITVNGHGVMQLYSRSIASDIELNNGGKLVISSGASATVSGITISGGTATIYDKGTIKEGTVEINTNPGYIKVSSGGVASNISALSNGHIDIYGGSVKYCNASGANAFIAIIDNQNGLIDNCSCYVNGKINVRNSATNLYAGAGGTIALYKNSDNGINTVASNVNIGNNGRLEVSGGFAYNVRNGGYADIYSNGKAEVVSNTGTLNVSSGGSVINGPGNTLTNASFVGGDGVIYGILENSNITDNSTISIGSSGTARNITIEDTSLQKYPSVHIYKDAKIESSIINRNGHLFLDESSAFRCTVSGASAYIAQPYNMVFNKMISCYCHGTGTLMIRGGAENCSAGADGIINVIGNRVSQTASGSAYNFEIQHGGVCGVYDNGVVNSCLISGNGTNNGYPILRTYSGGNAKNLTVSNFAEAQAYTNGSMSDIHLKNGGRLLVYPDSLVSNVYISSGGDAHTMSGGTNARIASVDIYSGGSFSLIGGECGNVKVYNGGKLTASNTNLVQLSIQSDGSADINYGANVSGFYDDYIVQDNINGNLNINGGKFYYIRNMANGSVTINNKGECYANSNSFLRNALVKDSGSYIYVQQGGTVESSIAQNYGCITIRQGGNANSCTVSSGGTLYVSAGGSIFNSLIKSGGTLFAERSNVNNVNREQGAVVIYI